VACVGLLLSAGCKRRPGKWGGTARSCEALPATCGPSANDDCCNSLLVTGGRFDRNYDGVDYLDRRYPATVSAFYLDKYEITVGRLRAFVNAGMGTGASPPGEGVGAHPKIAGSGWRPTWNAHLPANRAALKTALKCHAEYQTWTDTPASNENKPVNCLDWYTAFAFCAWDGGRVATDAEWHYAASGGGEQRYYPWSSPGTSTTVDDSYAVYCGGACRSLQNVGSKSPRGDGKWGQSDLAGNVWEWTLDWRGMPYPMPCHDCAEVEVKAGSYRSFRGGSFDDIAATLRSADRHVYYPEYRGFIGSRCARTP
jgi:formylglycine-generating enzyme